MLPLTSFEQITIHSHTPSVADPVLSNVKEECSQKDACAFDMPAPALSEGQLKPAFLAD